MSFALAPDMGVKRVEDLVALQLATEFKREVYRIVHASPAAMADYRYRGQLFDAASGVEGNIDEGWRRYRAREFAQFLRYASGSLGEALRRLKDGIDRGYFTEPTCQKAFELGDRSGGAITKLHNSLKPFFDKPR